MPAAAVIPAPIAYVKVVAVKKLVADRRGPRATGALRGDPCRGPGEARGLPPGGGSRAGDLDTIGTFKVGAAPRTAERGMTLARLRLGLSVLGPRARTIGTVGADRTGGRGVKS